MPRIKKSAKTISIIATTVFLLVVVGLGYPRLKTFFEIDRCLDAGGIWNYGRGSCELEAEQPLELIEFPCAVLIRPNLQKTEKLKKENSLDDFNTIVDDNEYYMTTSAEYLYSMKTKVISRSSDSSIAFKMADGTIFKFNAEAVFWGVLLFNGTTKPIEADMTNLIQDYESYMKN